MSAGTLTYMDRKGAGVCRRGELSELAKRMKTLRCPATLRAEDFMTSELVSGSGWLCPPIAWRP